MGQIVQRREHEAQPNAPHFEDSTHYRGEGLVIEVHRKIDFNPMVRIEWRRLKGYGGRKLKLFRNAMGFCTEDRPEDLTKHGQMILESQKNGQIEQQLAEGTYYYTFQYQKQGLFFESLSKPLRFQVEVPSLDTALKRIGDWQKVEELNHEQELRRLTRESERSQAVISLAATTKKLLAVCAMGSEDNVQRLIQQQVARIKEQIDVELGMTDGRKQLIADLQGSETFKSMSKTKQRQLVKLINDDLDADEQRFQP